MRIFVTVCATVLLVAHLGNRFAHAESRLETIERPFSDQKDADPSYAILANHLYTATQSSELADNTKAAETLPTGIREGVVDKLAQAFGSLKGDSSDLKSLCGKTNLANLRRVAEALRDGGNLGPEKITVAIIRLNNIVIKAIGDARKVCDPYLSAKWPTPWQPNFSDPAMEGRVVNLQRIANSYLYEGFVGLPKDPSWDLFWQASTMSYAVRNSQRQAGKSIDPDEPNPLTTKDTNVISLQLDEYVYKPCSEFILLDEAEEVLEPFNDMLKSWFVVSAGLLDQYYTNEDALKLNLSTDDTDLQVRQRAYSYQACKRFLATAKGEIAYKISEFREKENSRN